MVSQLSPDALAAFGSQPYQGDFSSLLDALKTISTSVQPAKTTLAQLGQQTAAGQPNPFVSTQPGPQVTNPQKFYNAMTAAFAPNLGNLTAAMKALVRRDLEGQGFVYDPRTGQYIPPQGYNLSQADFQQGVQNAINRAQAKLQPQIATGQQIAGNIEGSIAGYLQGLEAQRQQAFHEIPGNAPSVSGALFPDQQTASFVNLMNALTTEGASFQPFVEGQAGLHPGIEVRPGKGPEPVITRAHEGGGGIGDFVKSAIGAFGDTPIRLAGSPGAQTFTPGSDIPESVRQPFIEAGGLIGAGLEFPLNAILAGPAAPLEIASLISGTDVNPFPRADELAAAVVNALDISAPVVGDIQIGDVMGRQVGENITDLIVPREAWELAIELLPGIGAVPGVASAVVKSRLGQLVARKGIKAITREAVERIAREVAEATPETLARELRRTLGRQSPEDLARVLQRGPQSTQFGSGPPIGGAGDVVSKRVAPGRYQVTARGKEYLLVQGENKMWYLGLPDAPADDVFFTKAEALNALRSSGAGTQFGLSIGPMRFPEDAVRPGMGGLDDAARQADEAAGGQQVFHGTKSENFTGTPQKNIGIAGSAFYTTTDATEAREFGKVISFRISPKANLFSLDTPIGRAEAEEIIRAIDSQRADSIIRQLPQRDALKGEEVFSAINSVTPSGAMTEGFIRAGYDGVSYKKGRWQAIYNADVLINDLPATPARQADEAAQAAAGGAPPREPAIPGELADPEKPPPSLAGIRRAEQVQAASIKSGLQPGQKAGPVRQLVGVVNKAVKTPVNVLRAHNAYKGVTQSVYGTLMRELTPVITKLEDAWRLAPARYIGDQINPLADTLIDFLSHPSQYDNISDELIDLFRQFKQTTDSQLERLDDLYGADISFYRAPGGGIYIPNRIKADVLEAQAKAAGRRAKTGGKRAIQEERAYISPRERLIERPADELETSLFKLMDIHSRELGVVAGNNTRRAILRGKTLKELAEATSPELLTARRWLTSTVLRLRKQQRFWRQRIKEAGFADSLIDKEIAIQRRLQSRLAGQVEQAIDQIDELDALKHELDLAKAEQAAIQKLARQSDRLSAELGVIDDFSTLLARAERQVSDEVTAMLQKAAGELNPLRASQLTKLADRASRVKALRLIAEKVSGKQARTFMRQAELLDNRLGQLLNSKNITDAAVRNLDNQVKVLQGKIDSAITSASQGQRAASRTEARLLKQGVRTQRRVARATNRLDEIEDALNAATPELDKLNAAYRRADFTTGLEYDEITRTWVTPAEAKALRNISQTSFEADSLEFILYAAEEARILGLGAGDWSPLSIGQGALGAMSNPTVTARQAGHIVRASRSRSGRLAAWLEQDKEMLSLFEELHGRAVNISGDIPELRQAGRGAERIPVAGKLIGSANDQMQFIVEYGRFKAWENLVNIRRRLFPNEAIEDIGVAAMNAVDDLSPQVNLSRLGYSDLSRRVIGAPLTSASFLISPFRMAGRASIASAKLSAMMLKAGLNPRDAWRLLSAQEQFDLAGTVFLLGNISAITSASVAAFNDDPRYSMGEKLLQNLDPRHPNFWRIHTPVGGSISFGSAYRSAIRATVRTGEAIAEGEILDAINQAKRFGESKIAPTPRSIYDIMRNKDFLGREIRDEDTSALNQLKQAALYTLEGLNLVAGEIIRPLIRTGGEEELSIFDVAGAFGGFNYLDPPPFQEVDVRSAEIATNMLNNGTLSQDILSRTTMGNEPDPKDLFRHLTKPEKDLVISQLEREDPDLLQREIAAGLLRGNPLAVTEERIKERLPAFEDEAARIDKKLLAGEINGADARREWNDINSRLSAEIDAIRADPEFVRAIEELEERRKEKDLTDIEAATLDYFAIFDDTNVVSDTGKFNFDAYNEALEKWEIKWPSFTKEDVSPTRILSEQHRLQEAASDRIEEAGFWDATETAFRDWSRPFASSTDPIFQMASTADGYDDYLSKVEARFRNDFAAEGFDATTTELLVKRVMASFVANTGLSSSVQLARARIINQTPALLDDLGKWYSDSVSVYLLLAAELGREGVGIE